MIKIKLVLKRQARRLDLENIKITDIKRDRSNLAEIIFPKDLGNRKETKGKGKGAGSKENKNEYGDVLVKSGWQVF